MFLTNEEIRRRRLRRVAEWAGMAVTAFMVEIVLGLLLCM